MQWTVGETSMPHTRPSAIQKLRKKPSTKSKKLPSVKNQIRSVQRLLNKGTTNAKTRASLQQRLQELEATLAEHKRIEREKTLARRYHKVRFFERRKLTRALHKLQASIWGGHPTAAQARQLQQLQADLQYVMHFPRGEKYVSLLIKANTPEARAVQEQERTRLRALVAKQLAEKAVLTEANEGQNIDRGDVAKEQPVKSLLGPETEMISTDEHDDADSSDAEDGLPETDALPLGTQNAMHAARYDGSSTKAGRASSEVHVPVKTRAASMQNPAHAAHQLLSATGQGSADFDDDFFLADDANPGTSALPPPLQLPKQMTEGAMPKKRQQTVHGNKGVKDNKRRHTKLGVHHGKEENGHQVNTKSTSTPKQAKQVAKQEQPVRSRAEGGRKRRKKKE